MRHSFYRLTVLLALSGLASCAATESAETQATPPGETHLGSNIDQRVTVALKVDDEAAQRWLPSPWKVRPIPEGPLKGANLLNVFIDHYIQQDPAGSPTPDTTRSLALVVPAQHPETGESALFVARIYTPEGGPGPYENSTSATVRREARVVRANAEAGAGSEWWHVKNAAGGTLDFRMNYEGAMPQRVQGEARPHSPNDPDFYRIYRYDELMDVVESVPTGVDRVDGYEMRNTIPELGELFDGSEQLVGIAMIPWYSRNVYLPQ